MKIKKIKNRELEEILLGVGYLGTYAMPGDLTLAVIDSRKKIKAAYETYKEACKQIGEARCETDDSGKVITVYQKDEQGNEVKQAPKKLKFKDVSTEAFAVEELRKLGEQEVEIEVREFDNTVLESLKNITPIQMEAIEAMIEVKNLNPQLLNNN